MHHQPPCRLFGDRHLWSDEVVTRAQGLAAALHEQAPDPVRHLCLHLHAIPGNGSALAIAEATLGDGTTMTRTSVRDRAEEALDAVAAALVAMITDSEAVPA